MVAAVGARMGFLGAAGWFKEGAPGSRRARPIRKAGEHLGQGSRRSVASARRGGDETDSWAWDVVAER